MLQIQPPSPSSPTPPLFLPSDPPFAWLLAKAWVRNSDFQLHQLQYHLLNTHLVAEVIAVATMRRLPGLHPVFKVHAPPSLSRFRPQREETAREQTIWQQQTMFLPVCESKRGDEKEDCLPPETCMFVQSSHSAFLPDVLLKGPPAILRELLT